MKTLPRTLLTLNEETVEKYLWKNIREGDIVYLYTSHEGKEYACGPFRIISSQKRELARCDSMRSFIHFSEELYRLKS